MMDPRPYGGLLVDIEESPMRMGGMGRAGDRVPPVAHLMLWPPEADAQSSKRTSAIVGAPSLVLLVEDSPGDVRLIREAFREVNEGVYLHVAPDGIEAMSFLKRQGPHAHAPRPNLILLDLSLPRMDGREVLAQINEDPALKLIPTCVLTTSQADDDIRGSYQLRANAYLRKPLQLDAFEHLVQSINDFWLTKVLLPQRLTG